METEKLRLVAASLIFLTGIILMLLGLPSINRTIPLILFTSVWLLSASGSFAEAREAIKRKDYFNEFTLMLIASGGAFCIGEYPEGAAVMLLYAIGETLQERAVGKARTQIRSLLSARPQHANVIRNGIRLNVPPTDVAPGETVEVLPGERVPIDGILLASDAIFNAAALTGESLPRLIKAGNEVLSGMIPTSQPIRIRTNRPFSDSTLARLLDMTEHAAARRAPTEQFIRRFAHIYTPAVVVAACLLVLIPYIYSIATGTFHYEPRTWLYRALSFLVVSCPCALVISIPLSYFGGIGTAARHGIFFKGSNCLDTLACIDAIAFDKTGTLTRGIFNVQQVIPAPGFSAQRIASLAAVEIKSNHPIARALCNYAQSQHLPFPSVLHAEELPGLGMRAETEKGTVIIGKLELLNQFGVTGCPNKNSQTAATSAHIAIDGRYAGRFLLADEPKTDAKYTVTLLKKLGIKNLYILSGDSQELVEMLGRQIGITQCCGNLLPQDKVRLLEEIQSPTPNVRRRAAFVGDGMNDAPVLATASVGIAVCCDGNDLAIETADIIIQSSRPSKAAEALMIARRTRSVVIQNICGALCLKAAVLLLATVGYASLWAAVFADVGVTLLAITNSLRLLRTPASKK